MSLPRSSLLGASSLLSFLVVVLSSCGSSGGGGRADDGALTLLVSSSGSLTASDCVTLRGFQVESNRPLSELQVRHELAVDGVDHLLEDWRTQTFVAGRTLELALWKGRNTLRFRGREAEGDWAESAEQVVEVEGRAESIHLRAVETESGFTLRWDPLGDPGGDLELLVQEIDLDADPSGWSSLEALRVAPVPDVRPVRRGAVQVDRRTGVQSLKISVRTPTRPDPAHYAVALRGVDGCQSNVLVLRRNPGPVPLRWREVSPSTSFQASRVSNRFFRREAAPIALDALDIVQGAPGAALDGLPDVFVPSTAGTLASYVSAGEQLVSFPASPLGSPTPFYRALGAELTGDLRQDLLLVSERGIDAFLSQERVDFPFGRRALFLVPFDPTRVRLASDGACGDFNGDGLPDLAIAVVEHEPNRVDTARTRYLVGVDRRLADRSAALRWDEQLWIDSGGLDDLDSREFLVGDLDCDGRDDLLHTRTVLLEGSRWISELSRLPGGVETRFGTEFTGRRALRSDRSWLGDVSKDGYPDLVTLVEDSGEIRIAAFRNDGAGALQADARVFEIATGAESIEECSLRVADVEGDGLLDLVLHRGRPGLAPVHEVAIWAGMRSPLDGQQDWTRWGAMQRLAYPNPRNAEGSPQFLAEDLNSDGVLDFVSYGSGLAVLFSEVYGPPTPEEAVVRIGSSGSAMATEQRPARLDPARFGAGRDVFLGVLDRGSGVVVESLRGELPRDGRSFDFAGVRRQPVDGLAGVVRAAVASKRSPGPVRDVFAWTDTGEFGELRWDAARERFAWVDSGVRFVGEATLYPADLDGDPFGDCLVWERIPRQGSRLWVFQRSGRDSGGAGALRSGSLTLPGEVSFVDTLALRGPQRVGENDGLDECLVLIRGAGVVGSEFRVFSPQVHPPTGGVQMVQVETIRALDDFVDGVTDVAALHEGATVGVGDRGAADLLVATGAGQLLRAPLLAGVYLAATPYRPDAFEGQGPLQIEAEDVSGDGLQDLVLFDSTVGELRVLVASREPDADAPGVRVGTGGFRSAAPVRLPQHVPSLWVGRPFGPRGPVELLVQRDRGPFGFGAVERLELLRVEDASSR